MDNQRFHIDDPDAPGYYDPYNWGERPELSDEQIAEMVSDDTPPIDEVEIITEAMRKHMGHMGQ